MAAAVTDPAGVEPRVEVAPDKIEAAIAQRWRRIAEATKDRQGPPVTRAFLWNLIVSGPFATTGKIVDDIAAELPTRAIVLQRPEDGDGTLHTFLETNLSSGRHAVGSDEIIIQIGGPDERASDALRRVPSLVRSVLVPDALTALVWIDAPPPRDHVTRTFLGEVDRLILDSRRIPPRPDGELGLGAILTLQQRYPKLEIADLAWLGISPLRGLLAALFDPPHDAGPLAALDEVSVVSGVEGVQVRALLMLGWLGARLGWTEARQEAATRSGERLFWATRPDGMPVRLRLTTEPGGARHGVRALELRAGERRWSLVRDDEKIEVRAPDLPPRLQPARSHSVGERLAAALGQKGRDPNYRDALGFGAELAGAVPT
jgi:glucose-6-phosphate dehydrogenase assembly protein OpcA